MAKKETEALNNVVGFLNCLILLFAMPILLAGIWVSDDCGKNYSTPELAIGASLTGVSFAGVIAVGVLNSGRCRLNWPLGLYIMAVFFLIVGLLCFVIFAFAVAGNGAAGEVLRKLKVGDYSNWLEKRVYDTESWNGIRSCLAQSKFCLAQVDNSMNITSPALIHKLAIFEPAGCCKPPESCHFIHEDSSPFIWRKNSTADHKSLNPDCNAWSNDPKSLCFSCDSCKAGLLKDLKSHWEVFAILLILVLILLIIAWPLACCAFYYNWLDKANSHQPNPQA